MVSFFKHRIRCSIHSNLKKKVRYFLAYPCVLQCEWDFHSTTGTQLSQGVDPGHQHQDVGRWPESWPQWLPGEVQHDLPLQVIDAFNGLLSIIAHQKGLGLHVVELAELNEMTTSRRRPTSSFFVR